MKVYLQIYVAVLEMEISYRQIIRQKFKVDGRVLLDYFLSSFFTEITSIPAI